MRTNRDERKKNRKEEKQRFKSLDRTKFSLAGEILIISLLTSLITAIVSYGVMRRDVDEKVGQQRLELPEIKGEERIMRMPTSSVWKQVPRRSRKTA